MQPALRVLTIPEDLIFMMACDLELENP